MTNFSRFRYVSRVFRKILDPTSLSLIVVFISYMIYNSVKKFYTSKLDLDLTNKFYEATKIRQQVRIYDSQKADMISTPNRLYVSTGLIDLGLNDREIIALLIHNNAYHKRYHYGALATDITLTGILGSAADSLRKRSNLKNIPAMAFYFALLVIISEAAIDAAQTLLTKFKDSQAINVVKTYGYGPDLLTAYQKITESEKWYRIECGKVCRTFKKVEDILEHQPELKDKFKKILNDPDVQLQMSKSNSINDVKNTLDVNLNS